MSRVHPESTAMAESTEMQILKPRVSGNSQVIPFVIVFLRSGKNLVLFLYLFITISWSTKTMRVDLTPKDGQVDFRAAGRMGPNGGSALAGRSPVQVVVKFKLEFLISRE